MKQTVTQTFDGVHAITTIENHHEAPPCIGLAVALIIIVAWLTALTFRRR